MTHRTVTTLHHSLALVPMTGSTKRQVFLRFGKRTDVVKVTPPSRLALAGMQARAEHRIKGP